MSHLPDGWILTTVDYLSTSIQYGYTESANEKPVGPKFLRITDIQSGKVNWDSVPYCECSDNDLKKYLLESGDILFARTGATTGKSFLIDIPPKAIFASYLIRLRLQKEIDRKYFSYYLNSPSYWSQIIRLSKGSAQPGVNATILSNLHVPLAPLNEQKRIAEKLDRLLERVDACRAHLDRIPLLLKRFRQSVLAAATSGRLTADWREGNGIEENWKETTLGECGSVSGGLTKNAKRNMLELRKPYLRVANVYANKLELDDIAEIGLTQSEFEKTRLIQNDLLIVEGNGSLEQIGRAAIWNAQIPECAHQNHIIRWRTSGNTLPKFALFWLLSPEGRSFMISVSSSTSGLNTLSISKVSSIPIRLPATEEQAEIVRRVESLFAYGDRLEARYQAARAQVEKLTPALLAKAFRGELVPQDPNDEPASVLLERIRATRAANPKPQRAKRR